MSVLLAIMSYPGGNATVHRHFPFFKRQGADWIYGIGTTDGGCEWPNGISGEIDVGGDRYIDGPHLPTRLLDTIETLLLRPWRHLCLAEYDTLFLKPIPVESVKTVAGHFAGGPTWGSKAKCFVHNPWCFARDSAIRFLGAGRGAIAGGMCPDRLPHGASTPECSPDVFLAAVCEANAIPMQFDLWSEYSRNSLDVPGHLEEARQACRDGVQVIHGVKTNEQLEYILS